MHRTVFAGLTALDQNDQITIDGGSFLYGNTDVIDRLLQVGCVTHRHDAHLGVPDPIGQLSASVATTGGQLEAATPVFMGYTLTDAQGGETALSPVVVTNTQPQIVPDLPPPTASADYSGGSLKIGGYSYAFSYNDGAGGQTELQPAVFATREAGPASGQIILSGLAAGLASGLVQWEAWRAEEGSEYVLLATGTSDTFTDTGFTCTDCSARPPSVNTTNHTGLITIQLPAPEDDPSVGFATGINVYLCTDGSFSNPSLYAAYPVASGGNTFTVPTLVLGAGAPPPINRTIIGAHKIDPDSEISGPWKKAVSDSSALPLTGNTDGDTRGTLNDHAIHIWNQAAESWEILEGGGGSGGGSGHIIQNPAGTDMPAEVHLQFTGAVSVTDDGEHGRTVIAVSSGAIIDYRGPWAASATYKAGDAVARNGGSYLALVTSKGVDPATDEGAHWGILAVPGAEGAGSAVAIRWRGPWANSTTYAAYDAVSSEGGSYVSLASGNLGNPPVSDRTHWGIVALPGGGFTWRGPWSGATTYAAQDVVEREGTSYVSRVNENTGVDPLEDVSHTHWNVFVARGKDGEKGVPGASGVAGMRYRGNWVASADYIPNDVVTRGGSALISIAPSSNIGHDPLTDGFTHWGLVASKGERGASGFIGRDGEPGKEGKEGPKGTAGLRYRGEWKEHEDYNQYDVASRGGKYYVAKVFNKEHDPVTSPTQWELFHGEGPIESKVWADIGPVEPGTRPSFPIFIGTAEQAQRLIVARMSVESGEIHVTITHNGVPIKGLEGIPVTSTPTEIRLTTEGESEEKSGPVELATGDTVGMIVVSAEPEALGMSITAFVEHVVWGDAEAGATHEGPAGKDGAVGERGPPGASASAGVSVQASGVTVHGSTLVLVGSGGILTSVSDLGGGSARITINETGDEGGAHSLYVIRYSSGLEKYEEARPARPPGLVYYIGPIEPPDWLEGDTWLRT